MVREHMEANRAEVTGNSISQEQHHDRPVLIVVHEASGTPVGSLAALAEQNDRVRVLWLGTSWGSIPSFVPAWVDLTSAEGQVKPNGQIEALAEAPTIDPRSTSHTLAPLVDDSDVSAHSLGVPDQVPIAAVVDAYGPYWVDCTADELVLRFLVDAQGPFEMDLTDIGPHILVGGMTGSGKSEFLRAMICSLITRYHPTEASLLMVDFKGGSSLGDFLPTPHCVGLVSNLSEIDVERFIKFLEAELLRRQRIMSPFGGEYSSYRRSRRSGDPMVPRLLVLFDEFASFVDKRNREQTIVELAQKGRSLGMHMVLATQSPGSTISRSIRDNVGARFALRTADEAASQAIINVPDAAAIPRSARGRVLAWLGDGSVRQFQGAYTKGYSLASNADGAPVALSMTPRTPAQGRADSEDWKEIVERGGIHYAREGEGHKTYPGST